LRVAAVTGGGRSWSGYLALDRVGAVLSVLWHVGPRGVLTPGEFSAARHAAVAKARPLAKLLGPR
jgi:hypothetical protein